MRNQRSKQDVVPDGMVPVIWEAMGFEVKRTPVEEFEKARQKAKVNEREREHYRQYYRGALFVK